MPSAKDGKKVCSACRADLLVSAFGPNRAQPDGLQNQCLVCHRGARSRWKKAHPEQVNAGCKRWREKHPEHDKERVRRWINSNRAHVVAYNAQARASRLAAPGRGVTLVQWRKIVELWGGQCAYCGNDAEAQDHIIPLALNGEHDVLNVVPCCKSCNSAKKDRSPAGWMVSVRISYAAVMAKVQTIAASL